MLIQVHETRVPKEFRKSTEACEISYCELSIFSHSDISCTPSDLQYFALNTLTHKRIGLAIRNKCGVHHYSILAILNTCCVHILLMCGNPNMHYTIAESAFCSRLAPENLSYPLLKADVVLFWCCPSAFPSIILSIPPQPYLNDQWMLLFFFV